MYDPLEPYRFPKRHDFVVQECRVLDVREVVCWLTEEQYRTLDAVRLPITPRMDEATRAAYACPRCDGDGCLDCNYSGNRQGFRGHSHDVTLVARQCGAARRWHFLCPACRRPCEYLYLPPGEPGEERAPREAGK